MPLSIFDVLERARNGEQVERKEWDYSRVMMTTRSLVAEYQIGWDPKQIIPDDSTLVDRIFQAALDLASEIGLYNATTGRVMHFTRPEIEQALGDAPKEITFGEGVDARTLSARSVGDRRPPAVWAGNPGVPTPEELFLPMVMSWMKEPIVDLATCGSLVMVDGYTVLAGEPSEVLATRREVSLLREALNRAGRPGMGLLAAQSSVSELGDLSTSSQGWMRPTDAHLVPILNELAIDRGSLVRAANGRSYGVRNASLACVMVGGLAGYAPGAAVVQAASFMLANLAAQADYHLLHPIHIRHVATSTRAVMWVQSAVAQAFARNAPCVIVADIFPKSGALTRELLYEVAANAIAITFSGAHLEGVGAADGAAPNGTGLEARWMGEVGHAISRQGLRAAEANDLLLQLVQKYEAVFERPEGNPGARFDQACDLESLEPVPAWQAMYHEVKEDLGRLGLRT